MEIRCANKQQCRTCKIKNMCCANTDFSEDEIDGVCEDCGNDTCEGNAYDCCNYSPTKCETCGWSPCDNSC